MTSFFGDLFLKLKLKLGVVYIEVFEANNLCLVDKESFNCAHKELLIEIHKKKNRNFILFITTTLNT